MQILGTALLLGGFYILNGYFGVLYMKLTYIYYITILATAARRSLRERNGRNPEKCLSGDHPEAKTFPTVPQTCSYIAQATGFLVANAEFNRDASNRAVDGSSVN